MEETEEKPCPNCEETVEAQVLRVGSYFIGYACKKCGIHFTPLDEMK